MGHWKGIMKKLEILMLVILLLGLVTVAPVAAQGQEQVSATEEALAGATADEVGPRAATVMARLDSIVEDITGYRGRLAAASAEDSLVLRIQLANSRDSFMATLKDLAGVVVASEEDEAHHELRDRAEIVFTEVTPMIWEVIDELRTEIDGYRARRTGTAPVDRSALEDRVVLLTSRLNRIYQYGWDHIQSLDKLGQDTAGPREVFSGLLAGRADELSGRLQLDIQRVGKLNTRLKEAPDDADITALLVATSKNLHANAASQGVVLGLMDNLELPTRDLRTDLVTTTQDLASGLLDARVTVTLISQGWNGLISWLTENGPVFLVKLLLVLAVLFAGRLLAILVRKALTKSLEKARLGISQLLRRMIIKGVYNSVIGLAVLIALSQLGFSLGPVFAGLGVVGFILGFAMQDSLSNLAAGMMILINRPYDVGDLVEISGVFGKVEHMSMVSTTVLTVDNQKLMVPNSRIWGDVIKNVTDQRIRRVDLVFGISYGDDIPHAERVLDEILAANDMVLDDPEPMVRVHALGESSVDFVVRPWVKTKDYWDVHWDVTKTVKMRFDEEGISIPFPQQDVHFHGTEPVRQVEAPGNDSPRSTTPVQDPDENAGNEG